MAPGDEFYIAIDGEGVTPDTVDPRALLELSSSYLELMAALARAQGLRPTFVGLTIKNKCAAVCPSVLGVDVLQLLAETNRVVAEKAPSPKGGATLVDRVRRSCKHLPPGQHALVAAGAAKLPLELPSEHAPFIVESTSMRVVAVAANAKQNTVLVRATRDDVEFWLRAKLDLVREVGSNLGNHLEIRCRIRRNQFGIIRDGTLLSLQVAAECSPSEARAIWQNWFDSQGFDSSEFQVDPHEL